MPHRAARELIEREPVASAPPDATVREAARVMTAGRRGVVLIMEEGRLLGIFTERDLLEHVAATDRDAGGTRLAEVMTRDPETIAADAPAAEVIRKIDQFGSRYLPVLDGGTVIGVISARRLPLDECAAMAPELETRHRLVERML